MRVIANDPEIAAGSKTELWRRVMREAGAEPDKKHNQQLDVVLTLRSHGYIASG